MALYDQCMMAMYTLIFGSSSICHDATMPYTYLHGHCTKHVSMLLSYAVLLYQETCWNQDAVHGLTIHGSHCGVALAAMLLHRKP